MSHLSANNSLNGSESQFDNEYYAAPDGYESDGVDNGVTRGGSLSNKSDIHFTQKHIPAAQHNIATIAPEVASSEHAATEHADMDNLPALPSEVININDDGNGPLPSRIESQQHDALAHTVVSHPKQSRAVLTDIRYDPSGPLTTLKNHVKRNPHFYSGFAGAFIASTPLLGTMAWAIATGLATTAILATGVGAIVIAIAGAGAGYAIYKRLHQPPANETMIEESDVNLQALGAQGLSQTNAKALGPQIQHTSSFLFRTGFQFVIDSVMEDLRTRCDASDALHVLELSYDQIQDELEQLVLRHWISDKSYSPADADTDMRRFIENYIVTFRSVNEPDNSDREFNIQGVNERPIPSQVSSDDLVVSVNELLQWMGSTDGTAAEVASQLGRLNALAQIHWLGLSSEERNRTTPDKLVGGAINAVLASFDNLKLRTAIENIERYDSGGRQLARVLRRLNRLVGKDAAMLNPSNKSPQSHLQTQLNNLDAVYRSLISCIILRDESNKTRGETLGTLAQQTSSQKDHKKFQNELQPLLSSIDNLVSTTVAANTANQSI